MPTVDLRTGVWRCDGCGSMADSRDGALVCESDHRTAAERLAYSIRLYADTWPDIPSDQVE